MESRTADLLFKLKQTDWFCKVGMPLEVDARFVPIEGWKQAIQICGSELSKLARLEAQNELSTYLFSHHNAIYQQWNSKVIAIKPAVRELVELKLAAPRLRADIPGDARKAIGNALNWELLALCMAQEYESYFRTTYYELTKQLYLGGRFPCGWIGEVPDDFGGAFQMGKLAVY